MSLVEVPACLTVVAMVGGHGQAKKEGANCQVGRCLVFFWQDRGIGWSFYCLAERWQAKARMVVSKVAIGEKVEEAPE